MEGMVFHSSELTLKGGDILFMYTDGVTEAMNEKEELYADERLVKFLNSVQKNSVKEIIGGLMDDINIFSQGVPQTDDITIMAFQFKHKNKFID